MNGRAVNSPASSSSSESLHLQDSTLGGMTNQNADEDDATIIEDSPVGPLTEEERRHIANQRRHQESCCMLCFILCKLCGMCCYISCPPIPEFIARKLAFHPIKRGTTHSLVGTKDSGKTVHLESAKQAPKMVELRVEPLPEDPETTEAWMRVSGKTFVVKTKCGNRLVGHWIRASPEKCKVIIFSQPNSSDLGCFMQPNSISMTALSRTLRADMVFYDYSGFGYSTGSASEKNIYADIEAVYEYVRQQRGIDVEIVLMGLSMGTAASIDYASKNPPNIVGVVLLAPFTSGLRLFQAQPDREKPCYFDRFLSFDKIPQIKVPTLIIHGYKDQTVPIEHGIALHRRLSCPVEPLFVAYGNHSNILSINQVEIMQRIIHFVHVESLTLSSKGE